MKNASNMPNRDKRGSAGKAALVSTLNILLPGKERKYAELPVGGVPAFANTCAWLMNS